MVYGKGINDMGYGWRTENNWNNRIYKLWHRMIERCYDEKWHEKYPTYKDCYVCERWLTLSNFVEDIKLIENYELWLSGFSEKINPYQLDKDVKSNGTNKCYCLENCMFVTKSENSRQANKTRNYDDMRGENHPRYGKGYLISGEKNGMFGKHHSEETRAKISEAYHNKSDEEKAEIRRKISEIRKEKGLSKGEKNGRSRKVVLVDALTMQTVFTFKYKKQATDFYSISENTPNRYLKGKGKSGHLYNGFLWYYLNEWQQLNK